jgi:hypothetical protein
MSDLEISEMDESDLKATSGRSGVWDHSGILAFAKELGEKYPGKVIGMPLESLGTGKSEGFFNKFYKGAKKIKYISYYCRKHLLEAFTSIGIAADVRTNKNTLLVQLGAKVEESEELEQEEED